MRVNQQENSEMRKYMSKLDSAKLDNLILLGLHPLGHGSLISPVSQEEMAFDIDIELAFLEMERMDSKGDDALKCAGV
jgi:hypothetical protein